MTWQPTHEIEIVAGTPPGGGLDRTARALLRALVASRQLKVPARVVNIGGEGGRRAWAHVADRAGAGHVVLISAQNLIADRLMGVTALNFMQFTAIALLNTESIAFFVRLDSMIDGGADLVRRLAEDTAKVTFAFSTSRGNSNHITIAKVFHHAGADLGAANFRVFDSAPEAVADVVAGHADVAAVTAVTAAKELGLGQLRGIGISSPARLPDTFAACPTWGEQGLDCVVGSWRGVSGPPQLTPAQIQYWENMLAAATETEEWKADLARNYWIDSFMTGDVLQSHLRAEHDDTRAVLQEMGLLPGQERASRLAGE